MKPLLCLAAVAALALSALPANAQATRVSVLQELASERITLPERRHVHSVAFSPDGKTLAVGEDNVHLYDLSDSPPRRTGMFRARVAFGVHSLSFSPDGKKLAMGGGDHSIRIWSLDSGEETFQNRDHQGAVRSVCFAPDGALLAAGSDDKTVTLWEVGEDGSAKERAVIKAEDKYGDAVRVVFFSPKGKTLYIGCVNGAFRYFNVAGKPKQTGGFKAKSGYSGVSIAAPSDNRFWAISDRKTLHVVTASSDIPLAGHAADIRQVAVSLDGKVMASAGDDGKLAVWSVASRRIRISKERPGHFSCVACAQSADRDVEYTIAGGMESGDLFVLRAGFRKK
jgi:WD40 repeat protein